MNLGASLLSLFMLFTASPRGGTHVVAPLHSLAFVHPGAGAAASRWNEPGSRPRFVLPVVPRTTLAFRFSARSIWLAPASVFSRNPATDARGHRFGITDGVDLKREEARGGHTLQKHVAKSDSWLADRLRREPHITAASSYPDEETAERVVARTLEQNRAQLDSWLSRPGQRPNLVLEYHGDAPIGRVMPRGAGVSHPSSMAMVVLKAESGRDYIVLTTYPTDHGWAASNAIKW